jgi:hypothetical protein
MPERTTDWHRAVKRTLVGLMIIIPGKVLNASSISYVESMAKKFLLEVVKTRL